MGSFTGGKGKKQRRARYRHQGSCEGKHGHATKAEAERHLRRLLASPNVTGRSKERLEVYFCSHGQHWHVGKGRGENVPRLRVFRGATA